MNSQWDWIWLFDSLMLTRSADLVLKASILLCAAWAVQRFFRESPAARYRAWSLGLASLLLLPALSAIAVWPCAVLPVEVQSLLSSAPVTPRAVTFAVQPENGGESSLARASMEFEPGAQVELERALPIKGIAAGSQQEKRSGVEIASGPNGAAGAAPWMLQHPFGWRMSRLEVAGCLVWFCGFAICATPFLLTVLWHRRLFRRGVAIDDGELAGLAGHYATREGYAGYRLVESAEICTPLVLGLFHPTIFLPPAWRSWSLEMRRQVMLHEVAHLQRRDLIWQFTARLACSLFWMHPLAWLGLRRMRRERELACDARVVASGESPITYAENLISLARTPSRFVDVIAMAASGRCLEARIRAVLGATNKEREGMLSRQFTCASFVGAVLASILVSAPWIWVRKSAVAEDRGAAHDLGRGATAQADQLRRLAAEALRTAHAATGAEATRNLIDDPMQGAVPADIGLADASLIDAFVSESIAASQRRRRRKSGDAGAQLMEHLISQDRAGKLTLARLDSLSAKLQVSIQSDSEHARWRAAAARAYRRLGAPIAAREHAEGALRLNPSSFVRIRSLAVLSFVNRTTQNQSGDETRSLIPAIVGVMELSKYRASGIELDWRRLSASRLNPRQRRRLREMIGELGEYQKEFSDAIAGRQIGAEEAWRVALHDWFRMPIFASAKSNVAIPSPMPNAMSWHATFEWRRVYKASGHLVDTILGDKIFQSIVEGLRFDPDGPQVDVWGELLAHLGEDLSVHVDFSAKPTPRWLAFIPFKSPGPATKGFRRLLHADPDVAVITIAGESAWRINGMGNVYLCFHRNGLLIASNRELIELGLSK